MSMLKRNKGISLIALVVTIIVLLIIVGITIVTLTGENGILSKAKTAKKTSAEEQAKEKLMLVCNEVIMEKQTDANYKEAYLDQKLAEEGMIRLPGNIVSVDGWNFIIDPSVPKIGESLGLGNINENIIITISEPQMNEEFVQATITIEIGYEKEVSEISLNGEKLDIPPKQEGKYILQKTIDKNVNYCVVVKDQEGGYQVGTKQVTGITEDMEIKTAEDMKNFKKKVNEGRTFKGRRVTLVNDINLNEGKYTKNADGSISFSADAESWEPIKGNFSGTFEGKGKTIYGLYINNAERDTVLAQQAIFSYLLNARVENLKVKEGVIYAGSYSGAIVGKSENSTLFGCYSDVTIYYLNNHTSRHGCAIGGLCGSASGSTIEECENAGYIQGNWVGGIIGCPTKNTQILKCINQGTIEAKYHATNKDGWVGGICAYANAVGGTNKISSCYNTGYLTGIGNIR